MRPRVESAPDLSRLLASPGLAGQLLALAEAMRPSHWTKNFAIFAALVFSHRLAGLYDLTTVALGFAAFCLISSSVYLINDLIDLEKDRAHPSKARRPLPSGRLSARAALGAAILLASISMGLGFSINLHFGLLVSSYLLLFVLYSLALKHMVIIDVIIIAAGFVLRVAAGAVAIGVEMSNWLIICTIFLSLFLALCKRRHELLLLGESSRLHRASLLEYSPHFLDQMVAIATACTVMSYVLYTMGSDTVSRYGTRNMVFTIPFVIYGIFRYLFLVYKRNLGGNPEALLLKDMPLALAIVLYSLTVFVVLYA